MTGQSKLKSCQDLITNAFEQDMRVVILGVHLSFLTGMEDFFYRKNIEFLYIGKNIGEEYKVHMS